MHSVTRLVAATSLACLVFLPACGGDESTDLSADSAAAVGQINALCDEWNATVEARGDFPLVEFDAERPSPDDLPVVGNYFAAGHPARDEMIAAIGALSVPSEIQVRFDALVEALARGQTNAKEQSAAAQAGDVDGFTATLDEADASQQAIDAAADDLGASSCSA